MKSIKCNRYDCFGCRGVSCKVLKEAITDQPCPFYKTDRQLEDERCAAKERLRESGQEHLIADYINNPIGYRI